MWPPVSFSRSVAPAGQRCAQFDVGEFTWFFGRSPRGFLARETKRRMDRRNRYLQKSGEPPGSTDFGSSRFNQWTFSGLARPWLIFIPFKRGAILGILESCSPHSLVNFAVLLLRGRTGTSENIILIYIYICGYESYAWNTQSTIVGSTIHSHINVCRGCRDISHSEKNKKHLNLFRMWRGVVGVFG